MGSLPLYGGTFARSYSGSKVVLESGGFRPMPKKPKTPEKHTRTHSGDWNLTKICQNLKTTISDKFWQILTNFWQISGTPKNNRRDKFWTNLGFGVFLNAVRGKRVRNTHAHTQKLGLNDQLSVLSQSAGPSLHIIQALRAWVGIHWESMVLAKCSARKTALYIYITSFDGPIFRLQKVKKQRERWKNMARKGKDEKEDTTLKCETSTPSAFFIFNYKTGENWHFDLLLAHWLRLWPYIYIYIYIWLLPTRVPTFLASKPISPPRLGQKMAFFLLHKFGVKKNEAFQPYETRKHALPPSLHTKMTKNALKPLVLQCFDQKHVSNTGNVNNVFNVLPTCL